MGYFILVMYKYMEKCSNQMNFCWLITLQAKKCCSNIKFILSRMRDLIQRLIQIILFWWFFFHFLGDFTNSMFQGLRFPFKITPSVPQGTSSTETNSLWESKYFLLLLSSYILSDGKVSVFQFPLKLYHSGFQKKVSFWNDLSS